MTAEQQSAAQDKFLILYRNYGRDTQIEKIPLSWLAAINQSTFDDGENAVHLYFEAPAGHTPDAFSVLVNHTQEQQFLHALAYFVMLDKTPVFNLTLDPSLGPQLRQIMDASNRLLPMSRALVPYGFFRRNNPPMSPRI